MEALFPSWSEGLFLPSRLKSIRGGRGSAKSWTVARALLIMAAATKLRVLCAREFQNSIQDSVHKLLSEQVSELGLSGFYEVQQTTIIGANGSEFIYSGLRNNIQSLKSKEGIDRVWLEEAQTVSERSWETLVPTIRKEGSEIIATWNPDQDDDPTYQRLVVNPPDDCWSVMVNWDQNPWFPEVLRLEKNRLFASDPDAANHIWGGQVRRLTDAQVLRGRWVVEDFEPKPDWHGPYYGADWGFANDPTTLHRYWVHDQVLYVEWEAYGVGVDIEDTPALFDKVPGAREHVIRADSSRPETISGVRRHGYPRLMAAKKGPGSVEDGVEHLRSYKRIVIHPRCPHAAQEARLWSYKTDALTGDVLPVLVDKHNHCWDDARYALEPIIQRGKPKQQPAKPVDEPRDYASRKGSSAGGSWKTA